MDFAQQPRHLLVVDDEQPLARLVADYLTRDGFSVSLAFDGPAAVQAARDRAPDVVVLDLGLPGLDGIEVCRQLRTFTDCYVIMLTARTDEVDKLIGLSVGADDYLTKPFSPRELDRGEAIGDQADVEPGPGQVLGDEAGERLLVVDDEDPRARADRGHDRPSWRRWWRCPHRRTGRDRRCRASDPRRTSVADSSGRSAPASPNLHRNPSPTLRFRPESEDGRPAQRGEAKGPRWARRHRHRPRASRWSPSCTSRPATSVPTQSGPSPSSPATSRCASNFSTGPSRGGSG